MAEPVLSNEWKSAAEILSGRVFSVIMPSFNLEGRIFDNIGKVVSILEHSGLEFEVVVVDDGSADSTADEIRRAEKEIKRVKGVYIERNSGKGNALRCGFAASQGACVMLLDGDLDLLPERIPGFFDVMKRDNADIVIGSKRHKESSVKYPWHRKLASSVYYTIARVLTGLKVHDTQTGMKLFKREVLADAIDRMLVKTFAFDLELLAIACGRGAKISEAPVTLDFHTVFGALKPRNIREVLNDTLAIFYRLRFLKYYDKVEVPAAGGKPSFVSVVIACPHPSVYLDECLEGLSRQTYRKFEVIVLPDGEVPADYIKKHSIDGIEVVFKPTGRIRPAEKRNIGIDIAKGDVVAFIDDDAYPEREWLQSATRYFTINDIGGVGGPGVTPPGDSFLQKAGGRVYANIFVSGGYRFRYIAGTVKRDVDDYPSCNLFVRTDILREIGGFRLDFWPGEDTLLCLSIVKDKGKRLVYDPWAVVNHHRRALFGPHLRQLGRYAYHRGYFAKRFPETSLRLSYFLPSIFVLGVVGGAALWALSAFCGFGVFALWFGRAYCALTGYYTGLITVSSFAFNPVMWIMTVLGVFTTHIWYGVQFARGLMASKMPSETIKFDHPGDNAHGGAAENQT